MADSELKLGLQIPGESIVTAVLNYATSVRGTMSQENIDRADALWLKISEDSYAAWRVGAVRLKLLEK